VLWTSGRSTGERTNRQEGMMAMQALLGELLSFRVKYFLQTPIRN
jgi:hypothetical protein